MAWERSSASSLVSPSINPSLDQRTSYAQKRQAATSPPLNPPGSNNPWKDHLAADEALAKTLQQEEYRDIQMERDLLLAYSVANGTAVDGDVELAYFMSRETATLIVSTDAVAAGPHTPGASPHASFDPWGIDGETLEQRFSWEPQPEIEASAGESAASAPAVPPWSAQGSHGESDSSHTTRPYPQSHTPPRTDSPSVVPPMAPADTLRRVQDEAPNNYGEAIHSADAPPQGASTGSSFRPLQSGLPTSDSNSVLHSSGREIPFRDVLSLGTPQDRIQAFNTNREVIANQDTGLQEWLPAMGSQLSEHSDILHNNGRLSAQQMQLNWLEARELEKELRAKDAADKASFSEAKRLQAMFDKEAQEEEAWEDWKKSNIEECIVCGDEQHREELVRQCEHGYCDSCLQNGFKSALISKTPFKCCKKALSVEGCLGLSTEFVAEYEEMMLELSTPQPLYCCNAQCAKFLPPRAIVGDIGTCEKCRSQTCRHCRRWAHFGTFCEEDKETKAVKDLARQKGWRTCPGCNHLIERESGCLHMICSRCQTAFCYRCSKRWKDCESTCPDR
jgi:E3 ubiquitin-protein ligase RNF144